MLKDIINRSYFKQVTKVVTITECNNDLIIASETWMICIRSKYKYNSDYKELVKYCKENFKVVDIDDSLFYWNIANRHTFKTVNGRLRAINGVNQNGKIVKRIQGATRPCYCFVDNKLSKAFKRDNMVSYAVGGPYKPVVLNFVEYTLVIMPMKVEDFTPNTKEKDENQISL